MVSRKQRKRQLARAKWERQQSRRTQRQVRTRRRSVIVGAVVGVLAVIGAGVGVAYLAGWGDDPAAALDDPALDELPTEPPRAPRPTELGECIYVESGDIDTVVYDMPPDTAPAEQVTVEIETNLGAFVVELFGETAPCAVNSFLHLAAAGAYDDTSCTGLATEPAAAQYVECGDLTGSGMSGPGYMFANEADNLLEVGPGWLLMADGGDRNGSRFLITYGETNTFDEPLSIFGRIFEHRDHPDGMQVVRQLAEGGIVEGTDPAGLGIGWPAEELVVTGITVLADGNSDDNDSGTTEDGTEDEAGTGDDGGNGGDSGSGDDGDGDASSND